VRVGDTLRRALRAVRGDPAVRRNRATGTHCFYCGVGFSGDGGRRRTVDHRVPRGSGGTDGLANLVFACFACNQRKKDLPEEVFVASEWLARRRAELAGERGSDPSQG
jgi:5-methylcytosine-specific restriction endonuclease McrA